MWGGGGGASWIATGSMNVPHTRFHFYNEFS
jgi:hypothetical protein